MQTRIIQLDEFFGQLIVSKRKDLGLDQKTLALKIGIKQPALSRIERGETAVNTAILVKLAPALKITPAELMAEFDRKKAKIESDGSVKIVAKSEMPKSKVTLGKVLLGGAALALLIGTINK